MLILTWWWPTPGVLWIFVSAQSNSNLLWLHVVAKLLTAVNFHIILTILLKIQVICKTLFLVYMHLECFIDDSVSVCLNSAFSSPSITDSDSYSIWIRRKFETRHPSQILCFQNLRDATILSTHICRSLHSGQYNKDTISLPRLNPEKTGLPFTTHMHAVLSNDNAPTRDCKVILGRIKDDQRAFTNLINAAEDTQNLVQYVRPCQSFCHCESQIGVELNECQYFRL